MQTLHLSVAMCTFNGARFLREQLDSIASQRRRPDELIISDDNSTDQTIELLHDFARSCPFPIRIVRNDTTLGYTHNFQQTIELCDGELIALADQDDIWKPEKTETIVRTMQDNPAASYLFSDAEIVDEKGSLLPGTLWDRAGFSPSLRHRFSNGDQLRTLLKSNVVTGAAVAFRKSLTSIALPIGAGWVHDHWIASLGSCLTHGIAVSDRLLRYRRHSAQHIGIGRVPLVDEYREALNSTALTFTAKLACIRELQDRVQHLPIDNKEFLDNVGVIAEKATHLTKRAQLCSAGLLRPAAVFSEAMSGRYSTFSNSWQSILHDLCPPSLVGMLRTLSQR
jgi:glycosyltransferase involved in cell wall biosynthesis